MLANFNVFCYDEYRKDDRRNEYGKTRCGNRWEAERRKIDDF